MNYTRKFIQVVQKKKKKAIRFIVARLTTRHKGCLYILKIRYAFEYLLYFTILTLREVCGKKKLLPVSGVII